MGEIVLKTAKRATTVNRWAVRDAVTGAFDSKTAPKDIVRKATRKKATSKRA